MLSTFSSSFLRRPLIQKPNKQFWERRLSKQQKLSTWIRGTSSLTSLQSYIISHGHFLRVTPSTWPRLLTSPSITAPSISFPLLTLPGCNSLKSLTSYSHHLAQHQRQATTMIPKHTKFSYFKLQFLITLNENKLFNFK